MFYNARKCLAEFLLDPRRTAKSSNKLDRNILGDRDIEWSWIAARMPEGPGRALEVASDRSPLGMLSTLKGFKTTGTDLNIFDRPYSCAGLDYLQGDLLEMDLGQEEYDLVINCSSMEHMGLAGRYNVTIASDDGDLVLARKLKTAMKSGAVMLLTVPVGVDAVHGSLHRVYGETRLPKLIDGFNVAEEMYWSKDDGNRWVAVEKSKALSSQSISMSGHLYDNLYGLGCLLLVKP